MEWLVYLIIMIIVTIIQSILEYQKLKKHHVKKSIETTTTSLSDLDKLEKYGISKKLRKAVEVIVNETKSLNAVEYAKKISSVCFGSPSPKIKSNDPFGSVDDIPETPFYTYMPVPFTPTSSLFIPLTTSTTSIEGCLLDTGINIHPSSSGALQNARGDISGNIYILCKKTGQTISTVNTEDMVKILSTFLQYFWNGLIQNNDLGAWVAYSNMVIEEPYYRQQEALNYLLCLINYYHSTNKFYKATANTNGEVSFVELRSDYLNRISGLYVYKGYFCIIGSF